MTRKTWFRSLLAVTLFLLSGALFALALPPRDLNYLGWVAFLPFLLACRLARPSLAFLCSILSALLAARILVGPIDTAIQCANVIYIAGGLAAVFSLVAAFASFTANRLTPRAWVLLVSCAAVTGELLVRPYTPASMAMTQHSNLIALNLSTITGTWGVSFLMWLIPASVIVAVSKKASDQPLWPVILPVIAVVAAANIPWNNTASNESISAVVIQSPGSDIALEQTLRSARPGDIVVWPELLLDESDENPVNAAKELGCYVIADIQEKVSKDAVYNTAIVVSPKGNLIGKARKHHLFAKEVYDTKKGVSHPIKCGDATLGVAICYDTMYNDVTRKLSREGASVFFVPSWDPEAPNSIFNYLHSSMLPFRAAETRTALVWADSNGLSTIYDDHGRVIMQAPAQKITHLRTRVALRSPGMTLFTRFGDWFAYLCVMGVIALSWVSLSGKIKPRMNTD